MEALKEAVQACCPYAFEGASGTAFAGAILAVVAAHCAVIDDFQWPKDDAVNIFADSNATLHFDFIIVGAGTAGSLVANRLSNHNPKWSILVVEAGDDPGIDSEIPAFLFLNQNTSLDWNYKTDPDNKTCLGLNDNRCNWSKGKTMGGSSSINAMLYIRGHPQDYNNWENSGNIGWGYENLEPYFKEIEKDFNLSSYKYHENLWYDIIHQSWKELGYEKDENTDEAQIGLRQTKLLISKGKRLNSAKYYLHNLRNVRVVKNTAVKKIIIDSDSKTTIGVLIKHKNGISMKININNEVILSAGSIATPQLLMLSGIGPINHLINQNVEVIKDLPVGKNLHDHMLCPVYLKMNPNISTNVSPDIITSLLLQYMMTRTGPFSNIGVTDFMGFVDLNNQSQYPNIQFHHTYFTTKDRFMMRPYLQAVGYTEEIINSIEKINAESDTLAICPTLIHPKSRGEILLANTNSRTHPIIKANYFNDPDDMSTMLKAINFIHKLEETNTFKSLGLKIAYLNIPNCVSHAYNTDDYWECYIRHMGTTLYHPVGTVKMGVDDRTSVVDRDLRVHGVKKLRVVDASVMPTIPGSNTMAATLAIAGKAASLIINQYEYRDEL